MNYSVETCLHMIAHYERESSNWTKPATWHALARSSVASWKWRLEQVRAAQAA